MPIGYKMTNPDGTAFYDGKTQYAVGMVLECTECEPAEAGACAKGLHLSHEKYGPLSQNAKYPWALWECSYEEEDVIFRNEQKVRVRRLAVEKRLPDHDLGFQNSERVFDLIERAHRIKLRHNPKASKKIERCIKRQNEIFEGRTGKKIPYKEVKIHTIYEWDSVWASVRDSVRASVWDSVRDSVCDSVWDSVWDSVRDSVCDSVWDSVRASVRDSVWASVRASVRDSVWASVRDSVWDSVWASVIAENDEDNPFLPEFEILELGAVYYGTNDDGIAHVIMPGKNEVS